MIKKMIGLVVGAMLAATTAPAAINAVNEANTTGFTVMQAAMWPILGIVVFVAFLIMIIDEFL